MKRNFEEEGQSNLHDSIGEKIIASEIEGGARLDDLAVGKSLEVITQNRTYVIEKRTDGYYISGNPKYCPNPTKAEIPGSTFGGSAIKRGFIGRGMRLEFHVKGHRTITTTAIKDVVER